MRVIEDTVHQVIDQFTSFSSTGSDSYKTVAEQSPQLSSNTNVDFQEKLTQLVEGTNELKLAFGIPIGQINYDDSEFTEFFEAPTSLKSNDSAENW